MKRPSDTGPSGQSGRLASRLAACIAIVAAAVAALGLTSALGAFQQSANSVEIIYGAGVADANTACSGNQYVNWGGFRTDTEGDALYTGHTVWPASMGPDGKRKWSVAGSTNSFHGGRLTSIAYCKGGKAPIVRRKKAIVLPSAANDVFRYVQVSCPSGTHVIGGGWSAPDPDPKYQQRLAIMALERISKRTWRVAVANENSEQRGVTAIAMCSKHGKVPTEKRITVPVQEFHHATATAKCPGNKQALFGGFVGESNFLSGTNAFVFDFYLSGKKSVSAWAAYNGGGPAHIHVSHLTAIAYCT